jgi:hypothetical protein
MEMPNVLKHIGQNSGESFEQSDPIMIYWKFCKTDKILSESGSIPSYDVTGLYY